MSSKAALIFKRLALGLTALGGAVMIGAGGQAAMPDGRPTPTGLEVPRWITLKSSQVRARQGPGLDYEILWEYRAANLPVQVIAETREWRKICDPDGAVAWIHRTVASGRRSVFNPSSEPLAIHSSRSESSGVRARLQPRSTVGLDDCEGGWCRVRARKLNGWVQASRVIGSQERALCDAARPAGPGRLLASR